MNRVLLAVAGTVLLAGTGVANADSVYAYPSGSSNSGTLYAQEPDGSTTYFHRTPGADHYYGTSQNGHSVYLYPDGNGGYYGHDDTNGTDYYAHKRGWNY